MSMPQAICAPLRTHDNGARAVHIYLKYYKRIGVTGVNVK